LGGKREGWETAKKGGDMDIGFGGREVGLREKEEGWKGGR
jgi:hypothetical protein